MKYIYLIILITSTLAFTADLILRYMEKIKSFDFEKKFFTNLKGSTIPIEKFLPENLTMIIISLMSFSLAGSMLNFAGLEWYFSLPCALMSGLITCFIIQHLAQNTIDIIKKNRLPKGENAIGLNGYCTELIEAGGWGRVCLFYKDREFEVNAGNSTETDIDVGENVIAVYEDNSFYFVTKINEIYKGIDTNF